MARRPKASEARSSQKGHLELGFSSQSRETAEGFLVAGQHDRSRALPRSRGLWCGRQTGGKLLRKLFCDRGDGSWRLGLGCGGGTREKQSQKVFGG